MNWALMKNPLNWVTLFLMLAIAGAAGHLVLAYFGMEPSTPASAGPITTLSPDASRAQISAGVLGG